MADRQRVALQTGCSLARFFNYDKSNAVGNSRRQGYGRQDFDELSRIAPRSSSILYYIDEEDVDEEPDPSSPLIYDVASEDQALRNNKINLSPSHPGGVKGTEGMPDIPQ